MRASSGLAGSGVVLDPEKARGDLEPYSRMAGGMVKDALDEADISREGQPQRVIMIKCQNCGKLNEEDAKSVKNVANKCEPDSRSIVMGGPDAQRRRTVPGESAA